MTEKEQFMLEALKMAELAKENDEVPVGAVVVKDGKIIARAHNKKEEKNCATRHAEMLAIEEAAAHLNNWWLEDCELFVTLEPCIMCAGAMVLSRIKKLYFGAYDEKTGAAGSVSNVFEIKNNHKIEVEGGILKDECAAILSDFFSKKRRSKH